MNLLFKVEEGEAASWLRDSRIIAEGIEQALEVIVWLGKGKSYNKYFLSRKNIFV